MYHEGDKDNVFVFQKGKKTAQGYFINSNFVASVSGPIPVQGRVQAMSGATPVTQKKRTIQMGTFTYQDLKVKGQKRLNVVGPR